MNRSFKVEFREDHIHVEIAANFKIEPEREEEFWRGISQICDKHGSRRVLVEGFAPEDERAISEVIDSGMRTTVVPNMWLAICLDNFVQDDRSELFEVIALQQGVRVRFFSDAEAALQWLRVNSPA